MVPIVYDGTKTEIPVTHHWKPPRCVFCSTFGHSFDKCITRPREKNVTKPTKKVVAQPQKQVVDKDEWVRKS